MNPPHRHRKPLAALVGLFAAAVLLVACGSGATDATTQQSGAGGARTTPGGLTSGGGPSASGGEPATTPSTVAGGGSTSSRCYAGTKTRDDTTGDGQSAPPSSFAPAEGFGDVWVSGRPLAPYDSNSADPTIGCEAPHVVGQSFAGEPIDLSRSGVPTVLVFVAHWCPHCNREVPKLVTWLHRNGVPDGVRIVGVATGSRRQAPNWPPKTWLADLGWTQPTIADDADGQAGTAFGLAAYPYFVFLNADGSVFYRHEGEWDVSAFAAKVDELRSGGAADTSAASG